MSSDKEERTGQVRDENQMAVDLAEDLFLSDSDSECVPNGICLQESKCLPEIKVPSFTVNLNLRSEESPSHSDRFESGCQYDLKPVSEATPMKVHPVSPDVIQVSASAEERTKSFESGFVSAILPGAKAAVKDYSYLFNEVHETLENIKLKVEKNSSRIKQHVPYNTRISKSYFAEDPCELKLPSYTAQSESNICSESDTEGDSSESAVDSDSEQGNESCKITSYFTEGSCLNLREDLCERNLASDTAQSESKASLSSMCSESDIGGSASESAVDCDSQQGNKNCKLTLEEMGSMLENLLMNDECSEKTENVNFEEGTPPQKEGKLSGLLMNKSEQSPCNSLEPPFGMTDWSDFDTTDWSDSGCHDASSSTESCENAFPGKQKRGRLKKRRRSQSVAESEHISDTESSESDRSSTGCGAKHQSKKPKRVGGGLCLTSLFPKLNCKRSLASFSRSTCSDSAESRDAPESRKESITKFSCPAGNEQESFQDPAHALVEKRKSCGTGVEACGEEKIPECPPVLQREEGGMAGPEKPGESEYALSDQTCSSMDHKTVSVRKHDVSESEFVGSELQADMESGSAEGNISAEDPLVASQSELVSKENSDKPVCDGKPEYVTCKEPEHASSISTTETVPDNRHEGFSDQLYELAETGVKTSKEVLPNIADNVHGFQNCMQGLEMQSAANDEDSEAKLADNEDVSAFSQESCVTGDVSESNMILLADNTVLICGLCFESFDSANSLDTHATAHDISSSSFPSSAWNLFGEAEPFTEYHSTEDESDSETESLKHQETTVTSRMQASDRGQYQDDGASKDTHIENEQESSLKSSSPASSRKQPDCGSSFMKASASNASKKLGASETMHTAKHEHGKNKYAKTVSSRPDNSFVLNGTYVQITFHEHDPRSTSTVNNNNYSRERSEARSEERGTVVSKKPRAGSALENVPREQDRERCVQPNMSKITSMKVRGTKTCSKNLPVPLQLKQRFVCSVCNRKFSNDKKLKFHKLLHSEGGFHKCLKCPKTFSDEKDHNEHAKTHVEKTLACKICNNSYGTVSDLRRHSMSHLYESRKVCFVCSKRCVSYWDLDKHMRVHTGERPFTCSTCEKCFSDKRTMRLHMMTHEGRRNYKCDLCPRSFWDTGALRCHMRVHNDERPFKCELCKNSFRSKQRLKMHQQVHVLGKANVCIVCSNSFQSFPDLRCHADSHFARVPFTCDTCDRVFRDSDCLSAHIVWHALHKCPHCLKSFERVHELKRHKTNHRGVKTWVCHTCHDVFRTKHDLMQHASNRSCRKV